MVATGRTHTFRPRTKLRSDYLNQEFDLLYAKLAALQTTIGTNVVGSQPTSTEAVDEDFGVAWNGNTTEAPSANNLWDRSQLMIPVDSPTFTGTPTTINPVSDPHMSNSQYLVTEIESALSSFAAPTSTWDEFDAADNNPIPIQEWNEKFMERDTSVIDATTYVGNPSITFFNDTAWSAPPAANECAFAVFGGSREFLTNSATYVDTMSVQWAIQDNPFVAQMANFRTRHAPSSLYGNAWMKVNSLTFHNEDTVVSGGDTYQLFAQAYQIAPAGSSGGQHQRPRYVTLRFQQGIWYILGCRNNVSGVEMTTG